MPQVAAAIVDALSQFVESDRALAYVLLLVTPSFGAGFGLTAPVLNTFAGRARTVPPTLLALRGHRCAVRRKREVERQLVAARLNG
jgi:hypothetical protein